MADTETTEALCADGPMRVEHITLAVRGDRTEATCEKCGTGIDVGATFGPIPGRVMLAEWVKQHAHKAGS